MNQNIRIDKSTSGFGVELTRGRMDSVPNMFRVNLSVCDLTTF